MIKLHSRIYDTSAMIRISNKEEGYEKIAALLHAAGSGKAGKASALSAFEFLFSVGRTKGEQAAVALALFESTLDFVPVSFETAQRAAFLKLKYSKVNLSLADAIILQTGIDNGLEVVTCYREWSKIVEAKVLVV